MTAEPSVRAPADSVEGDWVVCLGAERSVDDGMVECPRAGGATIPVEACRACRLLAWHRNERDVSSCTIDDAERDLHASRRRLP